MVAPLYSTLSTAVSHCIALGHCAARCKSDPNRLLCDMCDCNRMHAVYKEIQCFQPSMRTSPPSFLYQDLPLVGFYQAELPLRRFSTMTSPPSFFYQDLNSVVSLPGPPLRRVSTRTSPPSFLWQNFGITSSRGSPEGSPQKDVHRWLFRRLSRRPSRKLSRRLSTETHREDS